MKRNFHDFSNKFVIFTAVILFVLGFLLLFRQTTAYGAERKKAQVYSHESDMDMNDDHKSMMIKDSKAYKEMQQLKDEDVRKGSEKNKKPEVDMSSEGINDM